MRPLAFLLTLALLAGCVKEEPAAPAANEAPILEGAAAPAAVEGAAADAGHLPHMHDYWEGRERVTLFDDAVEPATGDPFTTLGGTLQARLGATTWRFPDGAIVMEGTGQMELTATYEAPDVTSLAFVYRVGATMPWSEEHALASGETLALAITPATTDLPHQTTSRWELLFFPGESPGAFIGPFALRVDIVRMHDIMLFPGHPQLFEGKPEKVLHDAQHEHTEQSYAARAPQLLTEGGFQEKFVAPQELIPMETKAMRMEVDIVEASAKPGQVADIRFFYRGANTSYLGHPTVLPLEGSLAEKHLVYQVPVAPEETDTPYGEESQWLFFVEPATKFTGQKEEPDCGGCTEVSIQYRLRIIAYDHALDAYSERER